MFQIGFYGGFQCLEAIFLAFLKSFLYELVVEKVPQVLLHSCDVYRYSHSDQFFVQFVKLSQALSIDDFYATCAQYQPCNRRLR